MSGLSWADLTVWTRMRYLEHLATAPVTEVDRRDGLTTVVTGVESNTLNGVLHARLDDATADHVIAAVIARFHRRQVPAIWYLDSGSAPADLAQRLLAKGCRAEETGVVRGGTAANVLRRAELLTAQRRLEVEILPVRRPDQLERWFDALSSVWGAHDLTPQHRSAWLAVVGDEPVGAASAFFAGDVVLVDHEDVTPAARRSGVGSALIRAALLEARRRGCQWVVLEPTSEAAPFYEALGLVEEFCRPGVEFYLPLSPSAGAAA